VSLITTFVGSNAGVSEVVRLEPVAGSPWESITRLEVIEGTGQMEPALDSSPRAELRAGTSPGQRHGAPQAGRRSDDPTHHFDPPSK
jgi:hypothetical protein